MISFFVPIFSPKVTYLHSNFYLFLISLPFCSKMSGNVYLLSSLLPKTIFEEYDEIIFGCASFILVVLNVL